jgi:hypothetical protein
MIRRLGLSIVMALAVATPAWAGVMFEGAELDPGGQIRPALLGQALEALQAHPDMRRDVLGVVDFAASSRQPRFYVVDLRSGAVEAYLTAHGRGSDPDHAGVARVFSNDPGSYASSLGAYRTAESYTGKHGLSLALDGLDRTDDRARARAIVLHAAPYMTADFIRAHGKPGRSWGCFVVDPGVLRRVVDRLSKGALLFAGR